MKAGRIVMIVHFGSRVPTPEELAAMNVPGTMLMPCPAATRFATPPNRATSMTTRGVWRLDRDAPRLQGALLTHTFQSPFPQPRTRRAFWIRLNRMRRFNGVSAFGIAQAGESPQPE